MEEWKLFCDRVLDEDAKLFPKLIVGVVLTLAVILIWFICKKLGLANKFFVWLVTSGYTQYAHKWRTRLFDGMDMSSNIVEIGSGGGTNFSYFPVNSRVTCVEPVKEFSDHAERNAKRFGQHLKSVVTVQCFGEDMTSHIPESSVDYVVCTYVLCSVTDITAVLKNIRYILKPGGTFCFMEHTRSDFHPMKLYQELITPICWRLLNGCHYNRQPHKAIEEADIFDEFFYHEVTADCLPYYHPERTQVWGRAIKL